MEHSVLPMAIDKCYLGMCVNLLFAQTEEWAVITS